MNDEKRKVGWGPVNVHCRQTASQPVVKHKDEDHLTPHLLFKATLKRIPDLDYPNMSAAQHTRRPHPHRGAHWLMWHRAWKEGTSA